MSEETTSGKSRSIEFHVHSYPGGEHPTPLEIELGEETAILLVPCGTSLFPDVDKPDGLLVDLILSRTEPEAAVELLRAAKTAIDTYLQISEQELEKTLEGILGGGE